MSHLALYRKLRPKNFNEILEQEHIVRILKNQLRSNTIGHAYLFCGTRGTGKTSMAKILAKTLNCTELQEGVNPCDACESCIAALENRNLNIIEIDAASNNGVDNVREIREEVKYPPQDGGVKVYIIDEVHMLSTGAFNALLKTLEEPPSRVVFILATTDAQRLPATILSRCVRLDFKRISADAMSRALKEIADKEGFLITEEALRHICAVSDGAMRDALSLLDQCISLYQGEGSDKEEIDADKVLALTGAADNRVFFDLMDALITFDSAKSLAIISDMVDFGRDISRFISDFVHHLRNLLVISSTDDGKGAGTFDMPQSLREQYLGQSKKVNQTQLIGLIHEFSTLSASLRYSFNERIMLECLCIKLCNPQGAESGDFSAIISRLERLESMPLGHQNTQAAIIQNESPHPEQQAKIEEPGSKSSKKVSEFTSPAPKDIAPEHTPDDIKLIISEWNSLKKSFPPPLGAFLDGTSIAVEGEGLCVIFDDDSWIHHVKERIDAIKQTLLEKYGKDLALSLVSKAEYGSKQITGVKELPLESTTRKDQLPETLGGIEIEWE